VFSIDVEPPTWKYPGVIHLTGDSRGAGLMQELRDLTSGRRGLVLLDGDHRPEVVAEELDLYAPLADYMVVEDTIMRALGMPGPADALDPWLRLHPEWGVDPEPLLTQHPGGYLRRYPEEDV
jgi:cephalosporin hydroxylase